MKFTVFCDKVIEYSFYAIFLLVPLFFTNNTSELFELNKMWLTWGLTIIIGLAWFAKMIAQRQILFRRSPLDILLLLFLLSQIIATIFSLDTYVSLWGYYSRFNGGLYSLLAYIFLYFAFTANLKAREVFRVLFVSIAAGIVVAFWGIPSHFGYDPTCLLFRGTFDVSCWTSAFQPTIRIFSTLGQPAWLASYIGLLIPIVLALGIRKVYPALFTHNASQTAKKQTQPFLGIFSLRFLLYLIIATLFYITLLFSNTRAGFLAFWLANIGFWVVFFIKSQLQRKYVIRFFLAVNIIFLLCNFFFGSPIASLEKISFSELQHLGSKHTAVSTQAEAAAPSGTSSLESGGTDSGKIRLFVWKGAIDAWKTAPLFGTGVETFAYAYYLHKPVGHNLTSEWDYLYNKAHNEYLNYLTTTGIFGLGTYLLFIFVYLIIVAKYLLFYRVEKDRTQTENLSNFLVPLGLATAFVCTLIANFFGFSVVITNLYLFLIPAFTFLISKHIRAEKVLAFPKEAKSVQNINPYQWTAIIILTIVALVTVYRLAHYWSADTKYALGHNLDLAGQYQTAYPYLTQAVNMRPNEPVFRDELAVNEATLATALALQKDATNAALLSQQAINLDNQVLADHPNDVTLWKDRLRIFYTLAEADPKYMQGALSAALQAFALAPTDAKIAYNLGVIYEQTGNPDKAIDILTQVTTYIKPDYRDAYYALALAYHSKAVDKSENVIHPEFQQKAVEQLHYILKYLSPQDKPSKELLKSWGAS